jgi:hypothetical protein
MQYAASQHNLACTEKDTVVISSLTLLFIPLENASI